MNVSGKYQIFRWLNEYTSLVLLMSVNQRTWDTAIIFPPMYP